MIKVFFIDYYNKKDKRFSRNVTEELFEVFRKNKRKLRLDLSYDEIVTEK